MGVWLGPMGKPKAKRPPVFRFTVNGGVYGYTPEDFINAGGLNLTDEAKGGWIEGVGAYAEKALADGTYNWELELYASGSLAFSRVVPKVDFFLVGPGEEGGHGSAENRVAQGGKGGNGGELVTCNNVSVSEGNSYEVVVGISGIRPVPDVTPGRASVPTSISCGEDFSYAASCGGGKPGGAGAKRGDRGGVYTAAVDGKNGDRAFNGDNILLFPNYYYGASAAGAGARSSDYIVAAPGDSGYSGAGASGAYNSDGTQGADNSGSGGGAGGMDLGGGGYSASGGKPGGSGCIRIRNARSAT